MFAVIKTGGRQYRVVPDDVLETGKIAGDVGTIVQLGEVLLVGGESPVLGARHGPIGARNPPNPPVLAGFQAGFP